MNRASRGENPYPEADWTQSWKLTQVSEAEWAELRERLRMEAVTFEQAVGKLLTAGDIEMKGVIAGVSHLAYHLGAIRQINEMLRGPDAESGKD